MTQHNIIPTHHPVSTTLMSSETVTETIGFLPSTPQSSPWGQIKTKDIHKTLLACCLSHLDAVLWRIQTTRVFYRDNMSTKTLIVCPAPQ